MHGRCLVSADDESAAACEVGRLAVHSVVLNWSDDPDRLRMPLRASLIDF